MKLKVVLVEDDYPTIELYKEVFKLTNVDLKVFDWGEKAIEFLKKVREGKEEKPDLILLDLILPDISGLEILIEARKYPETRDIKIFALTNYTDEELNRELIKEGIDKILVKTEYTPRKLINLIKKNIK
jgi:CheY-like chemotaxis protein